jgi:hypothetical protein
MMRKLLGVAGLLAALMAFAVTAAVADTGGTDRPFTGGLVGSATFPADPSCPLAVRTVTEGSGTASHLGLVSMAASHCFALPNLMTQGEFTLVAANGDELHMTYTGTCNPPIPPLGGITTCIAENVIVGGTGRFVNATGEAQVTGLVTNTGAPPFPITWTWVGTLSY